MSDLTKHPSFLYAASQLLEAPKLRLFASRSRLNLFFKKSVLWQFRWFASVGFFASSQGRASKFHGIKIVTTGRSSPWRWLYKARGQKCWCICFFVCLYKVHPIFCIGSVKSVSRWQVYGWPLMTSLLKMERWTCSRSPLCQRCLFFDGIRTLPQNHRAVALLLSVQHNDT